MAELGSGSKSGPMSAPHCVGSYNQLCTLVVYPHPTVPVILVVCVPLVGCERIHECFTITRYLFNVSTSQGDGLALCACGFPAIIAQDKSKVIEVM